MPGFWRGVFSDGAPGGPSAGRVMMAMHFIIGGAWGTHVVWHTHAMIDPLQLTALTGFITAPYGLTAAKSALTNIFGNNQPPPPAPGPAPAPAP